MPIRFYCPLGHRLVVPDERAGKKGRCPQCHQKVYVPVANPRSGGPPEQPPAGQAIELDQAGDVPPIILDAPRGSPAQAAASPARRSSAAFGPVDPKDPLALAMDEITAMPPGKAIVYMPITEEAPSHSGSVSKWLPPKPAKLETEAPPAPAPPAVVGQPVVADAPASKPPPEAKGPMPKGPMPTAPLIALPATGPARGWIRTAEPDEIARSYRPDDTRLQIVYLLAGALMLVALMASWPALTHFRRNEAASWVAVVLFMSAANLVYVVWLLSLADWSTLRVGMVLCAVCAAVYGCGLAIVLSTPDIRPMALGLDEVRPSAGLWCALQFGLLSALSYGFGQQANAWRAEARGDW